MTHTEFVKTVTENVNKKYADEGKISLTNDNVKDDIKERTYIIKSIRKVIDNSLNLLGINPRYI